MLSTLRVQHYKSLFDTKIKLEPLTVFIGPNGSGKSNICEALAILSNFIQAIMEDFYANEIIVFAIPVIHFFESAFNKKTQNQQKLESKFWHGKLDYLSFEVSATPQKNKAGAEDNNDLFKLLFDIDYLGKNIEIVKNDHKGSKHKDIADIRNFLVDNQFPNSLVENAIKKVSIYDFTPGDLSNKSSTTSMGRTGEGIAYALVDILHSDREKFSELEDRLRRLVPNIQRISLPRGENQTFSLELIDKYSGYHIPATDISDGTLRILAFLTALYQENTPSIICFEEIENGVHPWLLHKMIELLKIVSTEGITGQPVQILITTHSPLLLNYVEPHQVRAVELDNEGKTQVHALPTDSARFQKALEAYDGELGELWFTNVFGGNPV